MPGSCLICGAEVPPDGELQARRLHHELEPAEAASPRDASPGPADLLAGLLAEQADLSAVERFSQAHDAATGPLQARYYRSLLPASPPGPGEQYAFEVDLDRCSGCKSCVTACHALNGLDERETWREVGLLHGGTPQLPILQHTTTACHHCLEPACLSACPVRAYEKHPATGIVRHLDDQCIGCQYCVFACPYDVPKYNRRLGIVRKCDMCRQRLAAGEAPACVQACPHEAIRIQVVGHDKVRSGCETNSFLPAAPRSTITFPTTTYKTARPLPANLLPADYHSVKREHAHWPLIVMLVLTQLSVGAFLFEVAIRRACDGDLLAAIHPAHSASALSFALIALSASVFHLGRPRYAFRALLGLGTSWLSREILAFGLFAGAAVVDAGISWRSAEDAGPIENAIGFAVVGCGLAGVLCSVMVYAVTRRAFWRGPSTAIKFLLSTAALGAATGLATSLFAAAWLERVSSIAVMTAYGQPLCVAVASSIAVKLVVEGAVLMHRDREWVLRRSAALLTGELAAVTKSRFICGFVGGIALPSILFQAGQSPEETSDLFLALVAGVLFIACLAGELLERYLFFAAVAPPRMPGGVGQ
ncbi:MAG TPA: DmsC/YnfH family molybdoenzyme membrane anchor subunit [Pirellulales bacterium]|nr:DmsC/YnfH family molybdoenzyme membrane anchor subunit [Pirellulales bacterium]